MMQRGKEREERERKKDCATFGFYFGNFGDEQQQQQQQQKKHLYHAVKEAWHDLSRPVFKNPGRYLVQYKRIPVRRVQFCIKHTNSNIIKKGYVMLSS